MTAKLSIFLAQLTLHQEVKDLTKLINMEEDP